MSAHRVVAVIVACFVVTGLLIVGGIVFAGYYLSSRVHIERDSTSRGETVRVETPFGRVRVDKSEDVDPKVLDLPLYPGATIVREGHSARVDLDLDFAEKALRFLAVEMETPDPFDKVVEYYREAAPDFLYSREAGGRVELLWQEGSLKKVIGIVERQGKTRIALANIGEPEAN